MLLTILKDANLEGASLLGVVNVDLKKLCQVKTLHNARLDADIIAAVRENCPHLLEKPGDRG